MELKDVTSEQLVAMCECYYKQLQRIVVNTEQILIAMKSKLDMGLEGIKEQVDNAEDIATLGDLFSAQIIASQDINTKMSEVFTEMGTRPMAVVVIKEPIAE